MMSERRVVNAITGGAKGQKLARFDLVPSDALWALAEHYGKGAQKYDERNWERGYDWSLNFAAAQRHLWQFWDGEDVDGETGASHLIATAWHCFALFHFLATHPELDDRPNQERKTPTADLASIDAAHLERQRTWSRETFGPGARLLSVVDHIRKELKEIEDNPKDVSEWADVLILAFDGAWRAGWEPQEIVDAVIAKQTKNEGRTWPDWRTSPPNQAIEHDRGRADRARLKYGCDDPDKCFAKGLHREVV